MVLLSNATARMLDGRCEGVDADLSYAKDRMDMLMPCRSVEPVAVCSYHSTRLCAAVINDKNLASSIFALLHADPARLSSPTAVWKDKQGPIVETLSMLPTDPFGRKQALSDVGSTRR
jgi:hypothetical protein